MPVAYGRDRAVERGDGSWSIVTPSAKGWRARTPATRLSAEHPGTAVAWDGALFEVIAVENGPEAARYTLAPWEDRHTIRGIEPYDAASEPAGFPVDHATARRNPDSTKR